MSNIIYREATNPDIPLLAKIRGDDAETRAFWNNRITGYMNLTHHPQHALDTRVIYLACADEAIIGFIAGHLTKRYNCEGELQWINVIDEYQNRGIASALVKLLANWFIDQRSYKICVDPGNVIVRNFYKKNGAEDLNTHWMFWEDIRNISW
jgi:ribosomal protein S18 acetylase RimI-like enzyme